MADIRAAQSGDFSATTTWVGGVVPGSGDVAYANTFTVTISDTRTVQAISNAAGTGITGGGTFLMVTGGDLKCTNTAGLIPLSTNVNNTLVSTSLSVGQSAKIEASVTAAYDLGGSSVIVLHGTAGALDFTGNFMGPGRGIAGILVSSSGTLNFTGNVNPAGGVGGGAVVVLLLNSTGSINFTGNATGVGGANVGSVAIENRGAGTITANGNVTGGSAAPGLTNTSSGTVIVNGTCQSGSGQPAIGLGNVNQVTRLSGPFLLGTSGSINPVTALSWRWAPTQIPTYYEVPTSDGTTKRSMFTSDNIPTANYPTAANVRSGTVYGPNLENTGTLAVPAPGSVALGVATDNTTGTAVLTSAAVQTALGAFSSGRLNNVATVDSTGAQIQAAVSA